MPIAQHISQLYVRLYELGKKIPKRDRFGLQVRIEGVCLECLEISLEAGLIDQTQKYIILKKLPVKIEVLKRLVRIGNEIRMFND